MPPTFVGPGLRRCSVVAAIAAVAVGCLWLGMCARGVDAHTRPLPPAAPMTLSAHPSVWYAAGADCLVVQAARDLGAVLERMTGIPWAVGPSDPLPDTGITVGTASELGYAVALPAGDPEEALVVRTHAGGAVLTGGGPLGVEHAVWRFAERLGYRSFFPTATWQVVPSVGPADAFAVDVASAPGSVARSLGFSSLLNGTDDVATTDACGARLGQVGQWERRNGVHGRKIHFGHAWKAHLCARVPFRARPGDADPDPGTIADAYATPGNPYVSRDLGAYCAGAPAPAAPTPRLCVTDPTTRAMFAAYANHVLSSPNAPDVVSVSPQDGVDGWDVGCPGDQGLSPSERLRSLADATAAAVPADKGVAFMAYAAAAAPPGPTFACGEACAPNEWLVATDQVGWNGATAETLLSRWAPYVNDDRRLVYLYWAVLPWTLSLPGAGRIVPVSDAVAELERMRQAGAAGFLGEATNAWGPAGLAYYLWARYAADPAGWDERALTEDFYQRAFGVRVDLARVDPANAPGIVRFYALLDGDPRPLPTRELVGQLYAALADAWGYTGPGDPPGTGDPAVDARLRDLFTYVRYVDLYVRLREAPPDPGDCAVGRALTPRQAAADRMVAHLYRVRDRWMTDVEGTMYAEAAFGMSCELDALAGGYDGCWDGKDPQSAMRGHPGCAQSHWPAEDDPNGAVVSDAEIARWIDEAPSPSLGFAPWMASSGADLAPAPALAVPVGAASRYGMYPNGYHRTDTVYDTWIDPATDGVRLEVTAGQIASDDAPSTGVTVTLVDPSGVEVDAALVDNDGVRVNPVLCPETCEVNGPRDGCDCAGTPPTGHYTLVVRGGELGVHLDLASAVRQGNIRHPATAHLSHRVSAFDDWNTQGVSDLYFYVPAGTPTLVVYKDGRTAIERRDPATGTWRASRPTGWADHGADRGGAGTWSAPEVKAGYVRIANPDPAVGGVWRFWQCRGRCYPVNVPPIVAFHPSELLLPAAVVTADRLSLGGHPARPGD